MDIYEDWDTEQIFKARVRLKKRVPSFNYEFIVESKSPVNNTVIYSYDRWIMEILDVNNKVVSEITWNKRYVKRIGRPKVDRSSTKGRNMLQDKFLKVNGKEIF